MIYDTKLSHHVILVAKLI